MLKKFPAKVLLLGEYTILNGSRALALPAAGLTMGEGVSKILTLVRGVA